MRVFYLCHRLPYPPDKGDKIRAFNQLRAIATRHEVDVFTLADDPRDLAHQPALAELCHRVAVARISPRIARVRALPSLFTRTPLTIPYFYSRELMRKIQKSLASRSYDRIFVYCSAMSQYVESVDRIPVLTDLVDVDSDKWIQYASFTRFPFSAIYRREGQRLREYERLILEKSAAAVVSTEREAQLARLIAPGAKIHVIPNGVDTAYFNPEIVPPERTLPTVVFTGDMSYFPNQEAVCYFARKVLPLVRRSVAETRFLIVGRNPGRNVRRLSQIAGVQVTGFVPDVRAYLAKAHVAVAPFSIAAGIQNKILEAMAYGLPVVATARTAQGLARGVAELVDTGNTAEEMAAKIVPLLRNSRLAQNQGVEGRMRVAKAYSWPHSAAKYLELLEDPASAQFPTAEAQSSLA